MSGIIQKIKTLYEKILLKKASYKKHGLSPLRDWKIIISFTALALFFDLMFSFYFYKQVDSGNFFIAESEATQQQVRLSDELLQKAVADFNARQTEFNRLKGGASVKQEPSS